VPTIDSSRHDWSDSRFAFLAFFALFAFLTISNLLVINALHGFDSRRLHQ
jgi:hypothetical protein